MSSEVKTAGLSGGAFVVGASGGAIGNQLGSWDTWYWWVMFVVLTLTGAGLAFWLSYRTTYGASSTIHQGENRVGDVSGSGTGVNYGTISHMPPKR